MKKYEIFSVFGIELEYIIVDINSFKIKNLSKIILKNKELKEKLNILNIDISYEMVQHVIELKTFSPELYGNEKLFTKNLEKAINIINDFLNFYNSKIVSLSMYPKIEKEEILLWNGKRRNIFKNYEKYFSFNNLSFYNMQSLQIMFPYENEKEMITLFNCIRLILPFVKNLSASSPFLNGEINNIESNRINYFINAQSKVHKKINSPITNYINNKKDYKNYLKDLEKIKNNYLKENNILANNIKSSWLNSQGAIVRFEFNAIELRLCDIQESPYMNMSLLHFIYEWVIYLYYNCKNLNIDNKELENIFDKNILSKKYLEIYEINEKYFIKDFLNYIFKVLNINPFFEKGIKEIINNNLSQRILKKNKEYSINIIEDIINSKKIYK